MHWSYVGDFLADKDFKLISGNGYLGQGFEIIFMLFVPLAIAKMGVKWAMSVGLVAQVVRFAAYLGSDVINPYIVYPGILVHGLIYGFFFVGGQIYINRKAPKEMQAQAQGFFFLITFGLGLIIANFLNGYLIDLLKTDAKSWASIWTVMTIVSGAVLAVFFLLFWDKPGEVDETVKAEVAEKAESA
jgi:MFS family permease